MKNKSPLERRQIAARAWATRRANKRANIGKRLDDARARAEYYTRTAARYAALAEKWAKQVKKLDAERERFERERLPLLIVQGESGGCELRIRRKYSAD